MPLNGRQGPSVPNGAAIAPAGSTPSEVFCRRLGPSAYRLLTSQTSYLSLGRAHEPRADVVELVEVSIPDAQGSALARAGLDLNLKAQRVRQILLKGTGIGILVAAVVAMGFATLAARLVLHQGLHGTHVEVLLDDAPRQRLSVVAPDQCPRVPRREAAILQQALHGCRQAQQAERVGKVAATFTDHFGHLLLRVAEPLDELAVAGCLLDGVEVGPLHILDEREFGGFLVAELAHDDGHRMQGSLLGCTPPPFAGDDLKTTTLAIGPCDDRLQQAFLADRIGKLVEFTVPERPARIAAAGVQLVDRQQALLALRCDPRLTRGGLTDERGKPTPQSAFLHRDRHGGSPALEDVRHWLCSTWAVALVPRMAATLKPPRSVTLRS